MLEKLKTLLILIVVVYAIALTTGYWFNTKLHLQDLETEHKLLEVEKASKKSLQSQLESYSQQQIDLLGLIQALDTDVKNLKYNLKTETKLIAADPVVEYKLLPDTHSYELTNGLRVADFAASDTYKFTTYDLSFRTIVVATDKKASSSLEVKSSYDDIWIQVPHELDFNNLEASRRLLQPLVVFGGQVGVVPLAPAGFIGISFVHPSESFSIGTIGAGLSNSPSLNFYPVDYNIGEPLPIFEDLRVAPGLSGTLPNDINFTIGLWTNL